MDHHQRSFTPQPSPSPSMSQKNRGLRSIFGKIKRSNSGNLEDLPGDGEFRRGGIRATAGARLGWNSTLPKPDKPFAEWDIDAVCGWLDEMGLGCYEDEARKWLKKGAKDLVSASPVDIEKELNLKTPLHRKKINLAVIDITGTDNDELFVNAGKLDPIWVRRELILSLIHTFYRPIHFRLCDGWTMLVFLNIRTFFQQLVSTAVCCID